MLKNRINIRKEIRMKLKEKTSFTMAERLSRVAERRRSSRIYIQRSKLAFTMAEILISLTIIGVIAAITLPSLRANINESAWATQRKALYSRMSQALSMLPSLNGYGSVVGRHGSGNEGPNGMVITYDDAAKTFLTKGLSTVLKINNICDSEHLTDCGFPSSIKKINGKGKIEISSISTFMGLHGIFYSQGYYHDTFYGSAGAFETANGESILVHYN